MDVTLFLGIMPIPDMASPIDSTFFIPDDVEFEDEFAVGSCCCACDVGFLTYSWLGEGGPPSKLALRELLPGGSPFTPRNCCLGFNELLNDALLMSELRRSTCEGCGRGSTIDGGPRSSLSHGESPALERL